MDLSPESGWFAAVIQLLSSVIKLDWLNCAEAAALLCCVFVCLVLSEAAPGDIRAARKDHSDDSSPCTGTNQSAVDDQHLRLSDKEASGEVNISKFRKSPLGVDILRSMAWRVGAGRCTHSVDVREALDFICAVFTLSH